MSLATSLKQLVILTVAISSSMNSIYGFVIINPKSLSSSFTSSQSSSTSSTYLQSSPNKKQNNEDSILREEWANDLASLGGDPSFLPDGYNDEDEWYADDAVVEEEDATLPSMSLMGVAGMPSVLNAVGRYGSGNNDKEDNNDEDEEESSDGADFDWDGVEDEDAHFD